MSTKLIGTDVKGTTNTAANWEIYAKFTAMDIGAVKEIMVYSLAGGDARVAIYDNTGSGGPGQLITGTDKPKTCVPGQPNAIPINDTFVTTGNVYWVGVCHNLLGTASYTGVDNSNLPCRLRKFSAGTTLDNFQWPASASAASAGTTLVEHGAQMSLAGYGTLGFPWRPRKIMGWSQMLLGSSTPGKDPVQKNRLILGRFPCTEKGTVNTIMVYSKANGHVKVAIYADSAKTPGIPAMIFALNNTSTQVKANQWNAIPISKLNVQKGWYYWLAVASDTYGATSYTNTGKGTSKGKSIDFSTFSWDFYLENTKFTDYKFERAFAGFSIATF
jgi:hypothetical protein